MQTYLNNYQELQFEKSKNIQHCKVKESIFIKVIQETNRQSFARQIVTLKQRIKDLFNISLQTKFIRLSHHINNEFGAEKELKTNIVTKHSKYKDKTTIKVYTDIDSKYLNKIPC